MKLHGCKSQLKHEGKRFRVILNSVNHSLFTIQTNIVLQYKMIMDFDIIQVLQMFCFDVCSLSKIITCNREVAYHIGSGQVQALKVMPIPL